ncbi:C4-dicarboxylate ABC transporter [Alkalilimnicola ehrlichii]|uniref:C4-dicarboxylate ABC transporter n=1 Tax=Alkalilimnicola ehrlichii TaxID=351052 RepID=A0A3E0WF75_9GAMM|nr:TRAP transporter substrate-binding protein DctP [Alkalilimnicola ehrlichii]RFA24387.1 C4-dicarboxylate ABC transporter [Alkalilimnicola ehrlichii]RFA31580.1 C4-dicarboxylate ABC transporter [Alkalilimnicola ehrlichii]
MRRWMLLCLFLVLTGCGDAPGDGTQQWRFALEEIDGSVQDAYAQRFKALVEERSGGDIEVLIYPYGTLGTSAQLSELIQNGTLEFAFASPGHLGSVVPEVQVMNLHFLFSEDNEANAEVLRDSPTIYGPLADAYMRRNLKLLAMIPEGWMAWTGNRPLRTPEDFQGFRIRTMVSPLLLEAYRAYGANPAPLPYAEVYSALQLNTIDGQVNPIFAIEEMSFYEVQDYLVMPRHLQFVASVVTNPQFYDGLDAETQAMLQDVKEELDDYIFQVQRDYNAERLNVIRENSDIEIIELSEEEREAFHALSLPVRERYVEMTGEQGERILEGLQEEFAAAEAGEFVGREDREN